jgi:hypothetical protein
LGTNFPGVVPPAAGGVGDGEAAAAPIVVAYNMAPPTPPINIDPTTVAARNALLIPFIANLPPVLIAPWWGVAT